MDDNMDTLGTLKLRTVKKHWHDVFLITVLKIYVNNMDTLGTLKRKCSILLHKTYFAMNTLSTVKKNAMISH